MTSLGSVPLGLVGICVLGVLLFVCARSEALCAALIGVTACAGSIPQGLPVISVGGISIHAEDLIFTGLLLNVFYKGVQTVPRVFMHPSTLWVVLSLMLGLAAIRGVLEFGLQAALNEARGFYYVIVAIAWGASVGSGDSSRLLRYTRLICIALLLTAFAHIMVSGVGSAVSGSSNAASDYESNRILQSGQALFLLIGALLEIAVRLRHRGLQNWIYVGLIVSTSILSQNRSVWAAAGVASLVGAGVWGATRRIAVFASLTVASLGLAVLLAFGQLQTLRSQFEASATSLGTYDGRRSSWAALLNDLWARSNFDKVAGLPFGFGYYRIIEGGVAQNFAPHNWYVSILLRAGLLGLVCWLAVLARILWLGARRADARPFVLPVIAAIATYSWAYSLNWYVAIFLGACLTATAPELKPTGRIVGSKLAEAIQDGSPTAVLAETAHVASMSPPRS